MIEHRGFNISLNNEPSKQSLNDSSRVRCIVIGLRRRSLSSDNSNLDEVKQCQFLSLWWGGLTQHQLHDMWQLNKTAHNAKSYTWVGNLDINDLWPNTSSGIPIKGNEYHKSSNDNMVKHRTCRTSTKWQTRSLVLVPLNSTTSNRSTQPTIQFCEAGMLIIYQLSQSI
ncbi:unnamed protein product [Caenorhabditis angaria]|uniref:Uncharacterized protein n=1 Tax=Caenorhabditis angaria TaxID=860376 RepID=A0A9P1N4E6_9PELO|nr:unnamed protein product [Caenorhabditis angaria]